MHSFSRNPFSTVLLVFTLLLTGTTFGQTLPLIRADSISITGNQVSIVVTDYGSGAASYKLESSQTMIGMWNPVTTTPVINGNEITFTVTKPAATKLFYRVVGVSPTGTPTPGDTDGDGLPDSVEGKDNYSEVLIFDTDMDGFSDGQEFAFGTLPRDPLDFPKLANLPAVQFAEPISSATEGSGGNSHMIPLEISGSFSGTVTYTVNVRSTAVQGTDFQTSGSVSVSGASGSIGITLTDDAEVSGERLIILDLDTSSTSYRRGGRASHVVCLSDNDAYWNGVLRDGTNERNFRLRMTRIAGGATAAAFVAGGADGTTPPNGVAGSQSVGIIPAAPTNVWSATSVTEQAANFRIVSPQIPEGAAGKIAGNANLQRILTLNATDPSLIGDQLISGSYEDAVLSSDSAKTYLNRTTTGNFVLIKASPTPADVETEFQP